MFEHLLKKPEEEISEYGPEDFLFRWKKLQRVIDKQELNGLLIVTGLDSNNQIDSTYLFNWLFLGMSGQEIFINKYLDPIYHEMVILLSSQGSHVFVTP